MPYPITAIVVPPTGPISIIEITAADPLAQFQALVGGDIEAIAVGEWASGYVHAEGFYAGLSINRRAHTLLGDRLVPGDLIQGVLVLTGPIGDDGVETSADVSAVETTLGEKIPEPRVCACGHRLGIHEFPLSCKGAIGYPDDQARCDCSREVAFLAIMSDRKLLDA